MTNPLPGSLPNPAPGSLQDVPNLIEEPPISIQQEIIQLPSGNAIPRPTWLDQVENSEDESKQDSLRARFTADPVLSDLSESEFDRGLGTQSQESQDTFSGITGGKKTKTKKSKKRTRKHRKILNQVKKLLKEI